MLLEYPYGILTLFNVWRNVFFFAFDNENKVGRNLPLSFGQSTFLIPISFRTFQDLRLSFDFVGSLRKVYKTLSQTFFSMCMTSRQWRNKLVSQ